MISLHVAIALCGLVLGLLCNAVCLLLSSGLVFFTILFAGPGGFSPQGFLLAFGEVVILQFFYLIGLFMSRKKPPKGPLGLLAVG